MGDKQMTMVKGAGKVVGLGLALLLVPMLSLAADVYWNDVNGGNWNDPTNWSTGVVPQETDNVLITLDGTYSVVMDSTPTVATLTIGGANGKQTLAATSGFMIVTGAVQVNDSGIFDFISFNLGGTDTLFNDGVILLRGTTINPHVVNSGAIAIQLGCTFNRTYYGDASSRVVINGTALGSAKMTVDTVFVNEGEVYLSSDHLIGSTVATLEMTKGPVTNESTGFIYVITGTANTNGNRYINAPIVNHGTIRTLEANLTVTCANKTLTNDGLIDVVTGNMTFALAGSTFNNTGNIETDSGWGITFSSGFFNHNGGDIIGGGGFTLSAVVSALNSPVVYSGQLSLVNSTMTLNDTLVNQHGTVTLATATIGGTGQLVNQDSMSIVTGTINAEFANMKTLVVNSAAIINGAFTTTDSSHIIIIGSPSGSATMTVADSVLNKGDIVLTSSDTDPGTEATLTITNGPLTNDRHGVITAARGSSTSGARSINAEIVNDGTIAVDQITLNLTKDPALHVNNGGILLDGGDLNIVMALKASRSWGKGATAPPSIINTGLIDLGAATQFSVTGGGIFNDTSGIIAGAGVLDFATSAFANDGIIEPGDSLGQLSLIGDLYNSVNAWLHIEIGGPTVGTDCDQFAVSGTATLDGSLDIALVNDYAPQIGDSVKILTFATRSWNFINVQGLVAGGYIFDTSWVADGLYIVCKAVPNVPPDWSGLPDSIDFRWDSTAVVNVYDGVSDAETDDTLLLYEFRITNTAAHLVWNSETGNLMISADSGLADDMYLIFDATDPEAATSTDTVVVTVRPAVINNAPVWSGLPDTVRIRNDSFFQFSLWDHVSDVETEDSLLSYGFEAHPDTLLADINPNTGIARLWTYPDYTGEVMLIANVSDPEFLQDHDTIILVVSGPNTAPEWSGLPDSVEFDITDTNTVMLFDYVADAETQDSHLIIDLNRTPFDLGFDYTTATGELLIYSLNGWTGTGRFYISATDPDSAKAWDTIVVTILPETGVGDEPSGRMPTEFMLNQNWPNPFNPTTSIEFGIPQATHVVVAVYNVLGARVAILVDQTLPAGYHAAVWDGTLTNGSPAASGIYFYRIETDQFVSVRKMVLLK
jgi:hypothetical protein